MVRKIVVGALILLAPAPILSASWLKITKEGAKDPYYIDTDCQQGTETGA